MTKNILVIAGAVMIFAASAQAHGSGYWGPEVQAELIKRTIEDGLIRFDNLNTVQLNHLCRLYSDCPKSVLHGSNDLKRNWLGAHQRS
jgi:hypothetical protein